MTTIQLDKVKVKQVTNASRTATSTMVYLGCFRKRARSVTNIGHLKTQLEQMDGPIAGRDYMDFWRGLEEAGAGSVILGRRGRYTRFEWNYSLLDIAKIAIEGKEAEIERLAFKRHPNAEVKPSIVVDEVPVVKIGKPKVKGAKRGRKPKAKHAVRQERLVFNIPVRPGYNLEINLPSDVSDKELEKIKGYLAVPLKQVTV